MPKDKPIKKRIEKLIYSLKETNYDSEESHYKYDDLLEEFILNYDESLLPLMKELIEIKKDFWYS